MSQKKLASKTSILLRRELHRQFPLCILSFFVLLAAMPGVSFVSMQALELQIDSLSDQEILEELLRGLYASSWTILMLGLLAVIAATTVFHYLHVKQQTDFYHALPLSRWELFWKQSLTGILTVVPAYVINLILLCLLYTVKGHGECLIVVLLLQKTVVELGLFAVVYAISVLACILCGSTLASLVVNFGLQVGGYALWKSILILFQTFYPARLLLIRNRDMSWLGPWKHHWNAMRYMPDVVGVDEPLGIVGRVSNGTIYQYNNVLVISLAYVLAAAVLLALAAVLYRQRKSERTGNAIVFRGLRLPIKYLAMTLCGVILGWILLWMTDVWVMMFVGMAAGVIFAQCVIEIVFALDFRAMFSHQLSLWLYIVVAAVVVGAMHVDITQYNVTLPSRSEIAAADIYSVDAALTTREYDRWEDSTSPASGMTKALLEEIEGSLLTDSHSIDEIYSMAQRGVQSMRDYRETLADNTEYDVVFRLKDGSTFVRAFYLASDDLSEEYNVLTKRAAEVRFSEEYLQSRTPAARVNTSEVEMLLVESSSQAECAGDLIEDQEAAAEILDTLREESMQLTVEYVTGHPPVLMLHTLPSGAWEARKANAAPGMHSLACDSRAEYNIPVYACEKATIKLLKKQGISVTRFTTSDVKSITLCYYPDKVEDKTLKNAVSLAEDEEEQYVTVADSSQFDDILAGAVASRILDCCDPIVQKNGVATTYDGYLDRTDGTIEYQYMKDKVPGGLQAYWE
ncbi:MAG: hypothetical protein Q4F79_07035 [Eubacteriales bacterium]|nr:hypothetical protein [Eubacteriales bacterium]